MERSTFGIDADGATYFPGITDGTTWNGFANPWMTRETLTAWYAEGERDGAWLYGESIRFTQDGRGIVASAQRGELEEEELERMEYEGETYYYVGSGWAWLDSRWTKEEE